MGESVEHGHATPEEAAIADIPPRYVRVVGVEISGDSAWVWLLTNEAPRFERYQVWCERRDGRWHADWGSGGFQTGTPARIDAEAHRQGWRGSTEPDVAPNA
jgi:hypothetical protein